MKPYLVDTLHDGMTTYYMIRYREDQSIVKWPTKYLKYRIETNHSPNTVKREAFALSYYLTFLEEEKLQVGDVCVLPYDQQTIHFTDFLQWLKRGKHTEEEHLQCPANATCNTYLRDVFGWYQFLELAEELQDLKVLASHVVTFSNREGIRLQTTHRVFKGYLPEEEHIGRTIEQENLLILLEHCTNLRDRVLLLLLAETGFRIGEMLGIRYTQDIDYQSRCLKVRFRENNANGARAKNAEYRRAKISAETFEVLMCYLAEHREILKNTEYLFVNLSGAYLGEPLGVNGVYAMLRRLEKKTGIKATPHMLRHYFANERRKAGWDLLLISKALGHRKIATTEKYLDVGSEELVAATDLYFQNHKNLYAIDQLL